MTKKIEDELGKTSKKILEFLGIEAEVKVSKIEEHYSVEINSNSNGLLIGKQGQNLTALERVLQVLFYEKLSEGETVGVDVGGFRQRRDEFIKNLAQSSIEEVLQTGVAKTLSGLTAAERKTIHLEVAKHPNLTSESLGVGANRVLMVKPKG